MIAAYTVVLALTLFTIGALDCPYDGGIVQVGRAALVSADAFEETPSTMEPSGGR